VSNTWPQRKVASYHSPPPASTYDRSSLLLPYKTSSFLTLFPRTLNIVSLAMTTVKRSADAAFLVQQLPGTPESASSPAASSSSDCPPRKRSRSDITPEERKEARAHRNRIAAQNSRDRRKAHFSNLERRVAELEEENRQLRAGRGLPAASEHSQPSFDAAREKENEELRERIKTLERGWDAVIKALAASGLPFAVPMPSSITAPSCPVDTSLITSKTAFFPPSPAPSSSSHGNEFDEFDSTRHLARVATTDAPLLSSVSLQRVDSIRTNLNSSSALPLPLRLLNSAKRRQLLPLTNTTWRASSVRSSRRRPYSRRQHCLSTQPVKSPPDRRR
jgi:hypothetical protein